MTRETFFWRVRKRELRERERGKKRESEFVEWKMISYLHVTLKLSNNVIRNLSFMIIGLAYFVSSHFGVDKDDEGFLAVLSLSSGRRMWMGDEKLALYFCTANRMNGIVWPYQMFIFESGQRHFSHLSPHFYGIVIKFNHKIKEEQTNV